jgi:hypothetical protein
MAGSGQAQEAGDFAVEESVGERAAVVALPAGGVQRSDGRRVAPFGRPESQLVLGWHR